MTKKILIFFTICLLTGSQTMAQQQNTVLITSDIRNFWNAYDHITATRDSARQYAYLDSLFLNKGTPGLKAIMQARQYTARSYINAINSYPLFWNSVRANTLRADEYAQAINRGINQLQKLYPELKPAKIYFTIGALRTGGTTIDSLVLIGAEIAMGDKHTVTTEFPGAFNHLRPFFDSEPMRSMVFTNIHEYIHTQQRTTVANTLLGQSLLEGVAEFIAAKAAGEPSATPAVHYGQMNEAAVKKAFTAEMFNPFTGYWLYSNQENPFHIRDLGYYTGYALCEKYYEKATDKKQAVREMIRLDYNDETALCHFAERSGYFTETMQNIKRRFEADRPVVTKVEHDLRKAVVTFSAPMDERYRNFEIGPLGEGNLMRVKKILGYSEDGRSLSFEVELKPDQHYQ